MIALRAVFDGMYGAEYRAMRIRRIRLHRQRADRARYVDDAPRGRFTEEWQHRLRDRDDAEHVRLEHRAHLVEGGDARSSGFRISSNGMPGFPACAMPALLTSTSRRPSSLRMRSAAAAIEA